jgi:hypothetical protein
VLLAAAFLSHIAAVADADDDLFAIQRIPVEGRAIQADLVDLDGDGIGDLLWVGVIGLPPDEQRRLFAHFGADGGVLPETPSWSGALPAGAAAYDLADTDDQAGVELLLLRRDRVTLLSLHGREPAWREILVPGEPTIAVVHDERGLDRFRLVRSGLGERRRILVPGLGRTTLFELDGRHVATFDVGARANYFVPPRPGPLVSESEIEIYFDHPRLEVGDVDGDGRGDLIAAGRHELRVFLQREEGTFAGTPDASIALRRVSEADHIRNSGSVRVTPHDFDGDGRVDLLLSVTSGSVFGGSTEVSLYRNVDGSWDLDQPDQRFEAEGGFSTHDLLDLDGDGRAELLSVRVPTGVLEIVETLITRAIDAEVKVYRSDGEQLFRTKPWFTMKRDLPISFETLRPKGFLATPEADFNADGRRDLLGSDGGERLEVRLGHPTLGFAKRSSTQELDTGGRIRFGDLEGDGRDDFVIYDPRRPGTPIRVGRSRIEPSISAGDAN